MPIITTTIKDANGTHTTTEEVTDAYADHFARHCVFRDALVAELGQAEEIEADNLRNPRLRNMDSVIAAKVRQLAIEQLLDGFDGHNVEASAAAAQ